MAAPALFSLAYKESEAIRMRTGGDIDLFEVS